MEIDIKLDTEEEDAIRGGDKMIIVRPKIEQFCKVSRGNIMKCNGISLLVLDVREYPRITDLFKIEKKEWIPTDAGDIVEAIKEYEDRYTGEKDKKTPFIAIEFSVQKD